MCRRSPLSFGIGCKLLRVFDNSRLSFLIGTGSTISTIQATSRNTSRDPCSKVLFSATANEIQTYSEKVLGVNFGSDCNYKWCFTKTGLKFFVIEIDFLTPQKVIVISCLKINRCLIDKSHKYIILLFLVYSAPPKICCILPKKKRTLLNKCPKILNPPHRYERKAHGIEHAIRTNGKIVKR